MVKVVGVLLLFREFVQPVVSEVAAFAHWTHERSAGIAKVHDDLGATHAVLNVALVGA